MPSPTTTNESKPTPPPIVYDLPPTPSKTSSTKVEHLLTTHRDKLVARAARFGTPATATVNEAAVLGTRRASLRKGFATGFDPHSAEQVAKLEQRRKRFGAVELERKDDVEEALVERPVIAGRMLETKRDVALGEDGREEALHLFGVDMLRTNDIMRYFREYGPSWVEWLNDSSCNVVFEDAFSMRRALKGVAREEEAPLSVMGDGAKDGMSVDGADDAQLDEAFRWRRAQGVRKDKGVMPLWVRQASEKDMRPSKPNPDSKWSRTMLRKQEEGRRRSSEGKSGRRGSREGGVYLGVSKADAIAKARAKRFTKDDLNRALSSA